MTDRYPLQFPQNLPAQVKHGSVNAYSNYQCHCPDCRKAWAEKARENRARRKAGGVPTNVQHGRYSTRVNYGCPCAPCKAAAAQYQRDYNARKKLT